MARRTKKPRHFYIIAAMRKIWFWSDERKEAVKRASVGPDLVKCMACATVLPRNAKYRGKRLWSVDHIDPCIPPSTGFSGWDDYLERLFVPAEKLQVLCNECHKAKSNEENKERRARRK